MKIVVCIKQVPDTTDVKINPQTNTLVRDGLRSVINPFDLFAVEEALALRDAHGGSVTIITMGPPQARAALEETVAMGADAAVLLSHRDFAGSDTLATSYVLSRAIERIGGVDLVLCGKQAIDGDTAQVGPGIAVHLDLPQAAFVRRVVNFADGAITVERMTEFGHDVVRAPLPCLITVVKDINRPRYASFAGKVRAKRMEIPVWGPKEIGCDRDQIGLEGSPTWVERIFPPPAREGCRPLPATAENIRAVVSAAAKDISIVWASRSSSTNASGAASA